MCRLFLSVYVVAVAACAVGRAAEPDEKLQRDLLAILQDRKAKPEIRSTAIRALSALGWSGRSALDDLVKLLDDPEERKLARATVGPWDTMGPYYYAIQLIGDMGPAAKTAVPSLVRAKGVVPGFDQTIDDALRNILQLPDVAGWVVNLHSADPSVRLMAAKALGNVPAEFAILYPLLIQSTNEKFEPDADVRKVARESAENVAQAEVTRLGRTLLFDRDANARLLAAKALGNMGRLASGAEEALKVAANKDPDADVRAVAKSALAKVTAKP
jgi:HEAT repeat protein